MKLQNELQALDNKFYKKKGGRAEAQWKAERKKLIQNYIDMGLKTGSNIFNTIKFTK